MTTSSLLAAPFETDYQPLTHFAHFYNKTFEQCQTQPIPAVMCTKVTLLRTREPVSQFEVALLVPCLTCIRITENTRMSTPGLSYYRPSLEPAHLPLVLKSTLKNCRSPINFASVKLVVLFSPIQVWSPGVVSSCVGLVRDKLKRRLCASYRCGALPTSGTVKPVIPKLTDWPLALLLILLTCEYCLPTNSGTCGGRGRQGVS